jgi:hypothetical protein
MIIHTTKSSIQNYWTIKFPYAIRLKVVEDLEKNKQNLFPGLRKKIVIFFVVVVST